MPNMLDDLNDCDLVDEDEMSIWDISEMKMWPDGTDSAYWIFFDPGKDEIVITEATYRCALCGKYFESFTVFDSHRGRRECIEEDNA